jgi:hypothetical protein
MEYMTVKNIIQKMQQTPPPPSKLKYKQYYPENAIC